MPSKTISQSWKPFYNHKSLFNSWLLFPSFHTSVTNTSKPFRINFSTSPPPSSFIPEFVTYKLFSLLAHHLKICWKVIFRALGKSAFLSELYYFCTEIIVLMLSVKTKSYKKLAEITVFYCQWFCWQKNWTII